MGLSAPNTPPAETGRRLSRRGPLAVLAVIVVVAAAGWSSRAQAACNLIPVAKKQFPSTLGGVESPVTKPTDIVRLSVTSCDASAGFEPIASDNEVTLTFEPPSGAGTTDVVIASGTIAVSACTLPGGRCSDLSFEMPDTTTGPLPDGLAGPARITVRDAGNVVVAEIGDLFLPTLGCDQQAETVFEQFTVLPKPNSFADAVSGFATELRATVDGSGSLLVPFDYWGDGSNSVLAETPGAPVAIFLQGSADLPAMGAGDPSSILDAIGQQSDPSSFIRSFTLDGRPLPPLLRITNTGEILGSADAVESVLRIARRERNGGPALYDLSDRLSASGRGPILISTFTAEKKSPIPLKGLRSSAKTVAFAREEAREGIPLNGDLDLADSVMQVVDAETGTSTNTDSAVALASTLLRNGYNHSQQLAAVPSADVDGDFAAFLEYEGDQDVDLNADLDKNDSFLRVYERDGTDLTAALDVEAAPVALVNGRPLAVTGSRVFFRGPNPFVEQKTNGVGGVTGLAAAYDSVVSPDGKHLYVVSSTGQSIVVFTRNQTTGRLTFVESEITPLGSPSAIAISPDGKNVYVTNVFNSGVVVYSRDDVTGQVTFLEQHQDGGGGEFGLDYANAVTVSPDGANVYVAARFDRSAVVYARNPLTGALTFLEAEQEGVSGVTGLGDVIRLIISPDGAHAYTLGNDAGLARLGIFTRSAIDGTLTFVSSQFGTDLIPATGLAISPDGKHVYVGSNTGSDFIVWGRNALTGALSGLQFTGSTGYIDGDGAGPEMMAGGGIVMSPDGARIYCGGQFISSGTVSLLTRNERTGGVNYAGSYFSQLGGVPHMFGVGSLSISPDGRFLYTTSTGDDSVYVFQTDLRLRAFNTFTQTLMTSQPAATVVRAAGERAVMVTNEALAGVDLNGDGDQRDEVAQVFDAVGNNDTVISLGIAANRVAISESLVAMTVPEAAEADVDLNGDGDKNDDVIIVYDLDNGQAIATNLAADRIAVSGKKVVFSVKEGDGTAGDITGDGFTNNRVMRVYDEPTGQTTEVGWAVDSFMVRGPIVAFLSPENAHPPYNLNGDVDGSDSVMQVYLLDTGELINVAQAGAACLLPGTCEQFRPFAIDVGRQTVTFLENESDQGVTDLNGDLDANDLVLQVFSLRSRTVQTVATVVNDSDPDLFETLDQHLPPFPEQFLEDSVSFQRVRESDINLDVNADGVIDDALVSLVAGDSDGDGMFDDFDACVDTSNPDGLDLDGDALGDSACDPLPAVCPPAPILGCKQAPSGKAKLTIKNSSDDAKDSVSWKWSRGAATTLADIGDPIAGLAHYSLCVYDASVAPQPTVSAAAVAQADCGGVPCWKRAGAKGVSYKDKTGHTSSTTQVKLTAGDAGKAKASFKAKGATFGGPTLPATTPVAVQLIVNEADRQACWESTFSTFQKSDGGQFSAKSD